MAKKRILIKVKNQSSSFAQAAPLLHQVENVIWIALVRGRDFL
jgi:hypothetical protein